MNQSSGLVRGRSRFSQTNRKTVEDRQRLLGNLPYDISEPLYRLHERLGACEDLSDDEIGRTIAGFFASAHERSTGQL
jgi:hypothetical protein